MVFFAPSFLFYVKGFCIHLLSFARYKDIKSLYSENSCEKFCTAEKNPCISPYFFLLTAKTKRRQRDKCTWCNVKSSLFHGQKSVKWVVCNRRTDTYTWMCNVYVLVDGSAVLWWWFCQMLRSHDAHIRYKQYHTHKHTRKHTHSAASNTHISHTLYKTNIINAQYVPLKCLFDGYGIKFYDFMRDDVHYVHTDQACSMRLVSTLPRNSFTFASVHMECCIKIPII